jgi:hypothetical protein
VVHLTHPDRKFRLAFGRFSEGKSSEWNHHDFGFPAKKRREMRREPMPYTLLAPESLMKTALVSFVLVCLVGLPSLALAGETPYSAQEYKHKGVSLAPEKIFLKKDKLWVRLLVINDTGKFLSVDKAQVRAKLASGAVVSRETGTFGKNPKLAVIQPGASHALYVEFIVGEAPAPVDVLLDRGFILEGKTLALPPLSVVPAK